MNKSRDINMLKHMIHKFVIEKFKVIIGKDIWNF